MTKPNIILALAAILWGLVMQASLFAAQPPAMLLDLSHWKLTLPVDTDRHGRPDEIQPSELYSFVDVHHFFVNEEAKGVVFRAYCGGATTKGSKYPRCELREITTNANVRGAWGTDDGITHTMTMIVAITKTPPIKSHVVCAQIHDAGDDVVMVRLEENKLFIERNSHAPVALDTNYILSTPFLLKIQAADGQIRVWHDGGLKMNWKVLAKGCYFKAGCYTQSNPDKGDAPDSFGEVVIYRLKVSHRKQP